MKRDYKIACEKAGMPTKEEALTPLDFEGIAYLVGVIYDGALDDEWIVCELRDARKQAGAIIEEFDDPTLDVVISEVYVGEDVIEPTGYMVDERFNVETEKCR